MKTSTPTLAVVPAARPGVRQSGVILIITLIMLVVTSSMAALAIKGTSSTEAIANNARTQGLAMQAAEAALRYCENGVRNSNETFQNRLNTINPTITQTMVPLAAPVGGATPIWANIASWQLNTRQSTIISFASLDNQGSLVATPVGAGNPGSFTSVFKRAPDCIAQYAATPAVAPSSYVVHIVARGFGPEVANDVVNPGEIPFGTEVFLHSTLLLN
jgi:Tfp pilus assembly protein PilX